MPHLGPEEVQHQVGLQALEQCRTADSDTATITVSAGTTYVYWVPAVAHAAGAQGSQWRADVGALNRGSGSTTPTFTLYTASGTSTWNPSTSIGAGDQAVYEDVVGSFGLIASGHLKIESSQPLTVSGRIYNQSSTGTFGQGMDGYTQGDGIASGEEVYLPLLSQTSSSRSNIGFANMSSSAAAVSVTLHLADGTSLGTFTVDLPAWQWKQDNEPFRVRYNRTNVVGGYAKVRVTSGSGVIAYASVVDSDTNDPTTILMRR